MAHSDDTLILIHSRAAIEHAGAIDDADAGAHQGSSVAQDLTATLELTACKKSKRVEL